MITDTHTRLADLANAARGAGAILPPVVATALEHAEMLAQPRATADYGTETAALVAHLGNPSAWEKARTAAIARLATVEAANTLDNSASDAADAAAWELVTQHGDAVAAAFAKALAGPVAEVNRLAPALPERVRPDRLDWLDPAEYAAYHALTGIDETLAPIERALAPLLAGTQVPGLTRPGWRRLMWWDTTEAHGAHQVVEALNGIRSVLSNGPLNTAAHLPHSALAHQGARFALAGPTEHARRAAQLAEAVSRPLVTFTR